METNTGMPRWVLTLLVYNRLELLDLSQNGLLALPPSLGQCTALVELLLGSNQLTCIPDEAGQLSSLRTLDLGRNRCACVVAAPSQCMPYATLCSVVRQTNCVSGLHGSKHDNQKTCNGWIAGLPASRWLPAGWLCRCWT